MSQMTLVRMQAIMEECDKFQLQLANDPTVLGPQYLMDMIATCRNYLNHVVMLFNEVRRCRIAVDFDLRRKQAAFKIASDDLLATNTVVRSLPNIRDRESQVNLLLRDDHRVIIDLDNDLRDLGHIEEFVRVRHRELKDTMREIQAQRTLMKDDRDTGGMYGDERPTTMGRSDRDAYTAGAHARPDDMDEAAIDRLLRGEVDPVEPVPPLLSEPQGASQSSEEADIRTFLNEADTEPDAPVEPAPNPSVADDNEYTDLLNTL